MMRMCRPIRIERIAMEGRVSRQGPGFRRHGMSLMVTRWIYIVMMMIIATPGRRTMMLAGSTSASAAGIALFGSLLLLLMDYFLLPRTIGIGRPRW